MGSANLKHCLEKSLDLNPATREFARSLLVGYSSGQRGRTVNVLALLIRNALSNKKSGDFSQKMAVYGRELLMITNWLWS